MNGEDSKVVIAVDGTSGSGKSTNSKLIAKNLGYTYVDTGAMYRTFAWYCLKHNVDLEKESAISQALSDWGAKIENREGKLWLVIDGYFPEKEIRTSEVSQIVSFIAANPDVRKWMKKAQQDCIEFGSLVMEGRDIGTNIFPDTPYKFYVDASLELREERRIAEGVVDNLAARDIRDSNRKHNPLTVAEGAVMVNTSGLKPDESAKFMLDKIQEISDSINN